MSAATIWDRARSASDSGRLSTALAETLAEQDLDGLREFAEALTMAADVVDEAREAMEGWQYAEGREERAETRETALDALSRVADAYDAIPIPESELLIALLADHLKAAEAGAA